MKQSKFFGYSQYNVAPKLLSRRHRFLTDTPGRGIAYMADILGVANCATPDSVFNVGVPICDLAKKKMKGVIFADRGVNFSGADIASAAAFIAAVKVATTAARGSRVYPIWDLLNFEDNTGDPSTGAIGNLTTATIVTSDAVPAFRYGYNGTEARQKRIAGLIGASVDVFFVDEQYAVYGKLNDDGSFGGFTVLQGYVYPSKFVVADAVNQYSFRVTLGSINEYRDLSTYVVTNAGIIAAAGLINVNLIDEAIANTGVRRVLAIADGGTNLEPIYGATISALTWTATNLQTGAAHAVTSVADTPGTDDYTVTLDATAWTALSAGDKVQINGPTAAALAAANVKPFEFIPVIVTKA